MENYTRSDSQPSYIWTVLAAAATVALCAVPYLNIPVHAAASDGADISAASEILVNFIVKAILMIPLLCVTPALWTRSAWRSRPAFLAILSLLAFGIGVVFGGSVAEGAYSLLLAAPYSIVLFFLQKEKSTNFQCVFYGSVLLLISLFGRICGPSLAAEGDAFLPLKNLAAAYETEWNNVVGLMQGLAEPQQEILGLFSDTLKQLRVYPEVSMLQFLYYPSALAALCNVLLSHLFNRRGGADLRKLPPFEEWTVESGYFYGSLVLTVIAYILTMTGVSYGMGLLQVAYAIWMLPLALAGLCAIKHWTKRRVWIFVLVCVFSVSMFSVFGQMLAVVGMLRFMYQRMRRRMQGGDK